MATQTEGAGAPIGFIGVGAMGSSIAGRLTGAYRLLVHDRDPARAADLVKAGAVFGTVDDIAQACRIVFLCLPGPAEVEGLMLGPHGLAARLSPGSVVVDMTTSSPTVDQAIIGALHERGIDLVDAPIAGGVRRAQQGSATLMVGAEPETLARVREVLESVTSQVFHVGPVGAGHAMKLVNNLLNACNRFAALECVQLAESAGLPRAVAIEVINASTARNYTTEYTYPQFLLGQERFLPQGFTIGLMRKDLGLALDLADDLDHDAPIARLVQTMTMAAVERFGSGADQSQLMAEWYARTEAPQPGSPTR